MDAEKIGKRLVKLRGNRTLNTVAESVGVSLSAIAMYEAGERIPRDEIKVRLAKYYGCTVESLFYS